MTDKDQPNVALPLMLSYLTPMVANASMVKKKVTNTLYNTYDFETSIFHKPISLLITKANYLKYPLENQEEYSNANANAITSYE